MLGLKFASEHRELNVDYNFVMTATIIIECWFDNGKVKIRIWPVTWLFINLLVEMKY